MGPSLATRLDWLQKASINQPILTIQKPIALLPNWLQLEFS